MAVARAVGLPLLLACAAAFAPAAIPRRGLRVSAIAAEDVAADEAEQLRAEAARLREEVASMEAEVLASRPAPPPPPDDDDDEPFSTAVAPLRWAGPYPALALRFPELATAAQKERGLSLIHI